MPVDTIISKGERTMLQETVRRLDGLDEEHPRRAIGVLDPVKGVHAVQLDADARRWLYTEYHGVRNYG